MSASTTNHATDDIDPNNFVSQATPEMLRIASGQDELPTPPPAPTPSETRLERIARERAEKEWAMYSPHPTGKAVDAPDRAASITTLAAFARRIVNGEVRDNGDGTYTETATPQEAEAAKQYSNRTRTWGQTIADVFRVAQSAWERSHVPPRYFGADLNNLGEVPAAYRDTANTLRDMIDMPAMNALIGKRGPGKTHLACGLVREFCRHRKSARYATAFDVFRAIRDTWGKGSENRESKVIAEFESVELLVLDEMQVRSESAWENAILTDLLDHRYSHIKSTVLIANLDVKALQASVGDSIASRMVEMGRVITCNWPSFRTPGRPQPTPTQKFPPVDAQVFSWVEPRYHSIALGRTRIDL